MTGFLRARSAAKADPLAKRMKAAPETMEMARLLIWESPEPTILPSENGIRRCPRGYPADFRPVLLCSHAGRMSALGHKRTFRSVRAMSALPRKADIGTRPRPVPFSFWIDPRVAGLSVAPQLVGSVSAHVGCPFLLLTLVGSLWLRRQLKHRRLLSLS